MIKNASSGVQHTLWLQDNTIFMNICRVNPPPPTVIERRYSNNILALFNIFVEIYRNSIAYDVYNKHDHDLRILHEDYAADGLLKECFK